MREIGPLYFGGAGVNPSRLRPGSGFGLGLGAFFASFLPLSLLPMRASMTQKPTRRKDPIHIRRIVTREASYGWNYLIARCPILPQSYRGRVRYLDYR